MATRNSAFRVAIGGLALAVMLCLVAAVSLLGNAANQVARVDSPSSEEVAAEPIRVAMTGDDQGLMNGPPIRPVPDHPDVSHDSETAPDVALLDSAHDLESAAPELRVAESPSPVKPVPAPTSPAELVPHYSALQYSALEESLIQLRGEVNELARSQLESQLAAIRDAEALLVQHNTSRDLDRLAGEIEALKAEALKNQAEAITAPPAPVTPTTPDTLPEQTVEKTEPASAPPAEVPDVLIRESEAAPGKFDVDADSVALNTLIGELAPHAGWNVVSASRSKARITCHWRSVDLPTTLHQLLKVHELQARQDGELTIVEPLPPALPVESPEGSDWPSTTAQQPAPVSEERVRPPFDIEITPARPGRNLSPATEQEARKPDPQSTSIPRKAAWGMPQVTIRPESPAIPSVPVMAASERSEPVVPDSESPVADTSVPDQQSEVAASEQSFVSSANDQATSLVELGNDDWKPTGTPAITPRIAAAAPLLIAPPETIAPTYTPPTRLAVPRGALQPVLRTAEPPVSASVPAPVDVAQPTVETADFPAVASTVVVPDVVIQATVVQIRHTDADSRGLYLRGGLVTDTGVCAVCGEKHRLEELPAGHSEQGWSGLPDGVAAGVSSLAPSLLVQRIQQLAAGATMTQTPAVRVPSGRLAEIGLTEQQGFRRYLFRGRQGSEQIGFLEGSVQLAIRPTIAEDGSLTIQLRPSSTIERINAESPSDLTEIRVPAGSSVVLGGFYFDTAQKDAERPTGWLQLVPGKKGLPQGMHEVIVILDARPAGVAAAVVGGDNRRATFQGF